MSDKKYLDDIDIKLRSITALEDARWYKAAKLRNTPDNNKQALLKSRRVGLLHTSYLRYAVQFGNDMSRASKHRVGCLITKDGRVVSNGFNGTVPNLDNSCENLLGDTLPEVIHAEANALAFCAKQGIATKSTIMYITLAPCIECAKLIIQSGVQAVLYSRTTTKGTAGIELLNRAGVRNEQVDI